MNVDLATGTTARRRPPDSRPGALVPRDGALQEVMAMSRADTPGTPPVLGAEPLLAGLASMPMHR